MGSPQRNYHSATRTQIDHPQPDSSGVVLPLNEPPVLLLIPTRAGVADLFHFAEAPFHPRHSNCKYGPALICGSQSIAAGSELCRRSLND